MTRQQLIDAYRSGRISRRSFVRGLVALGVPVRLAQQAADKYVMPNAEEHMDYPPDNDSAVSLAKVLG